MSTIIQRLGADRLTTADRERVLDVIDAAHDYVHDQSFGYETSLRRLAEALEELELDNGKPL